MEKRDDEGRWILGGPLGKNWNYDWRRRIFRFGIWAFLYRFWIKLRVDGWENIPATGPVIMMGNHISSMDPLVMISFYPDRDIVPLAKIESFSTPFIRYFVGHWGAIPVNRGEADTSAFKSAIKHIDNDHVVMFYTEGTRNRTGLIEGHEGTAYLALKTQATVVPVAIWGSREFPSTWTKDFRRTEISLRFGPPFRFRNEGRRIPRDLLRPMTDAAMYRIAELLPEDMRGVYSNLSEAQTDLLDFDLEWEPVRRSLPKRVLAKQGTAPS
jgi:1-acyl-sn-glycerol-3-phosphate acyltransferase